MIKRFNKKLFFRISLIVSSVIALFTGSLRMKDDGVLTNALDIPLGSIEKVYADAGGAGDCSGDMGDINNTGLYFPSETSSGLGIWWATPTVNSGSYSCGGTNTGYSGCFIAGTKVRMADGVEKNIEDVIAGDLVVTSEEPKQVVKPLQIPFSGKLYAFNGSENYFVTPSHPFMTDEGWKSIDPTETAKEMPDLPVEKLAVGDVLHMRDGKKMNLTSMESKEAECTVYNMEVEGTHEYYADEYLVHNKVKYMDP